MDANAYRSKAAEIRKAIAAMELDIETPHMALLIKSMYSDEYKDDSYQRLEYLAVVAVVGRDWKDMPELRR